MERFEESGQVLELVRAGLDQFHRHRLSAAGLIWLSAIAWGSGGALHAVLIGGRRAAWPSGKSKKPGGTSAGLEPFHNPDD